MKSDRGAVCKHKEVWQSRPDKRGHRVCTKKKKSCGWFIQIYIYINFVHRSVSRGLQSAPADETEASTRFLEEMNTILREEEIATSAPPLINHQGELQAFFSNNVLINEQTSTPVTEIALDSSQDWLDNAVETHAAADSTLLELD